MKGYPEYSDLTDKSMVDSQLDYIKANMQAYKLISQASLVILFLLSVLTGKNDKIKMIKLKYAIIQNT